MGNLDCVHMHIIFPQTIHHLIFPYYTVALMFISEDWKMEGSQHF